MSATTKAPPVAQPTTPAPAPAPTNSFLTGLSLLPRLHNELGDHERRNPAENHNFNYAAEHIGKRLAEFGIRCSDAAMLKGFCYALAHACLTDSPSTDTETMMAEFSRVEAEGLLPEPVETSANSGDFDRIKTAVPVTTPVGPLLAEVRVEARSDDRQRQVLEYIACKCADLDSEILHAGELEERARLLVDRLNESITHMGWLADMAGNFGVRGDAVAWMTWPTFQRTHTTSQEARS